MKTGWIELENEDEELTRTAYGISLTKAAAWL